MPKREITKQEYNENSETNVQMMKFVHDHLTMQNFIYGVRGEKLIKDNDKYYMCWEEYGTLD